MATTLGRKATPNEWARALVIAEGYLIGAAQARRLATYRELNAVIRTAVGGEIGPQGWGLFLGDLVEATYPRYGVMLSAAIVRTDQLTPGDGFAALASAKGLLQEGESDSAATERLRGELFRRFRAA